MTSDTFLSKNEGMWLPNKLPLKQLKKYYKFSPDEGWSEHLQKACVRMNSGGSASFVSNSGLMVTNHHVAASILHDLSSAKKDYFADGFYAKEQKDELKAPKLEVNVLWEIEDVTERVQGAMDSKKSAAAKNEARKAIISEIEKESLENTGLRSDVVTLYQGGAYHLYRYKKYTDVRLVFAPESAIGAFGGDFDNYEYPRYCLDMTFFRVYENNKPLESEHYLTWKKDNSKKKDLCFVAGHPGTTDRLTTLSRIEYLRDYGLPRWMDNLRRWEISAQQYSGRSPEKKRQASQELSTWQNIRKRWGGQLEALQDPAFMKEVAEKEAFVREEIRTRDDLKSADKAWDAIEKTNKLLLKIRDEMGFFEGGRGLRTSYFSLARGFVRLFDEDTKPNEKRLPEYSDARRAELMQSLLSPRPIYPEFEEHKLADSLAHMLEVFGADDPDVEYILDGKSPPARARELIKASKMYKVATRKKIAKDGKKALDALNDPFVAIVRRIDERSRAVRKQYEEKVDQVEQEAYGTIARALFDLFGDKVYPDATFTLRVSYGEIVSYTPRKVPEQTWTTIGGVFAHADKHERDGLWTLPKSWEKKEKTLAKDTSMFNFLTSHDTHGGNSGSPVVDRDLNIIGLLFDGLMHSQGGDSYHFMNVPDHSVSVHTAGIYSVLKSVYGATRLIKELDQSAKKKFELNN